MPIDRLDFENLAENDLAELLVAQVPEGLRIDYKRDLYGNSDADKRELLKDVSGFTNAFPDQPYPGAYLPAHTTFDLSLGKDFGERFSASLNAMNVANRRVELDNSVTFGGFHWNNPREIFAELRYRFHY